MTEWILPQGYTGSPWVYMVVAVVAFAMTGISKGGFGGVAVLAIPLMMLVADGKLALGIWVPLLILCDICTIILFPTEWKLRPILILAPWMLAGFVVGFLLLGYFDDRLMKLFVGYLSIGFVTLEVVRALLAKRLNQTGEQKPWQPTLLTAAPFGLVGGVCSMIAHAAGAITTIYLLPQKLGQRHFVGTSARFYIVFNIVKIPFYAAPSVGVVTQEAFIKSIWMMPLVPVTIWMGAALNKRITPATFNSVIYVLLAISGVYLIYNYS